MKIKKLNNLLTSNLHFLSLTQVAAGEMVQNELQPPYKGVSKHEVAAHIAATNPPK